MHEFDSSFPFENLRSIPDAKPGIGTRPATAGRENGRARIRPTNVQRIDGEKGLIWIKDSFAPFGAIFSQWVVLRKQITTETIHTSTK
jgi:hypothetical protein